MSPDIQRDFSQVKHPGLAEELTRVHDLVQQIEKWPFPAKELLHSLFSGVKGGRRDNLFCLVRDNRIIELTRAEGRAFFVNPDGIMAFAALNWWDTTYKAGRNGRRNSEIMIAEVKRDLGLHPLVKRIKDPIYRNRRGSRLAVGSEHIATRAEVDRPVALQKTLAERIPQIEREKLQFLRPWNGRGLLLAWYDEVGLFPDLDDVRCVELVDNRPSIVEVQNAFPKWLLQLLMFNAAVCNLMTDQPEQYDPELEDLTY